jgi:hypothetical protein
VEKAAQERVGSVQEVANTGGSASDAGSRGWLPALFAGSGNIFSCASIDLREGCGYNNETFEAESLNAWGEKCSGQRQLLKKFA